MLILIMRLPALQNEITRDSLEYDMSAHPSFLAILFTSSKFRAVIDVLRLLNVGAIRVVTEGRILRVASRLCNDHLICTVLLNPVQGVMMRITIKRGSTFTDIKMLGVYYFCVKAGIEL